MNLDIKKECNNVMVIVPHQDDEILMSAGVIRVCEQNNVPYTVVMVTNGDYGCIDYSKGYARLKESLAVCRYWNAGKGKLFDTSV